MSEEKLDSEVKEERPPDRDESKSAAERRSEARRAAREAATKKRAEAAAEAKPGKSPPRSRKPVTKQRPGAKPKAAPKERPVSKARERREREARTRRPAAPPQRRRRERSRYVRTEGPGPARLFALLAGAFLSLLGVIGLFFDSSFDTGADLASDDLAGILMVNGWRNAIYVVTGLAALALAARRPRATAMGLGLLYLVYAGWGFIVTERDIGDILGFLPLSNEDNVLHLVIGSLGLLAALVDGPLPKPPEAIRKRMRRPRRAARKRSAATRRQRSSRPVAKRPVAKKPERREAGKKPASRSQGDEPERDRKPSGPSESA